LNDEKIISQPRLELVKMKCPVSRRAFSSYAGVLQERLKTRTLQSKNASEQQRFKIED